MPLDFKQALFEVALNPLGNTEDPTDPESIRDAIRGNTHQTHVGLVDFNNGPAPTISKTPLAGGQWSMAGGRPELRIVENADHPDIATTGEFRLIES